MEQVSSGLTQVVEAWRGLIKISAENEKRKKFMQTAKMCTYFYAGAMGFMWDETFRKNFLGGMPSPEFKLTIAKAFEMVAIMVPNLLWDYPGRISKPVKRVEIPIEVFGDPNDPNVQGIYQEYSAHQKQNKAMDDVACKLMDTYLNYSQREQPGGGLVKESENAIIDAIVKGRGVMLTEPYRFPGSDKTLTRSRYIDVSNLYIDPDSQSSNLTDAGWIAIRHRDRWFDLERKFPGIVPGSLRDQSTHESLESLGVNQTSDDSIKRNKGMTADTIEWYEIYSKIGVGTRLRRVKSTLHDAFEEVVGDYARICIAPGVNYPLNFPPKLAEMADDDMAREAFDWQVPYWKDGRWPVSLLDFYSIPNNPWPIAPLAMGLGELVFLNIMHSCLAERVYHTSRNLMFVRPEIGDEALAAIKNGSFSAVIEMNPQLQEGIEKFVSFLQMPQIPSDAFSMWTMTMEQFERRTGLSPLLYGSTPDNKVLRSAADAQLKQDAAGIRTEDMGRKVERWQTDIANNERICAGWSVKGEDLIDLFGDENLVGLWNQLISGADPETYVRQMRTTLEANSLKKPNKVRDVNNLQAVSGWMIPMLQWYATLSMQMGEPNFEPLNGFIKAFADSIDQDPENWVLPPMEPPQPMGPEGDPQAEMAMQAQQEQQSQQLQQANDKHQMELASQQIDQQKKLVELQKAQDDAEAKKQAAQFQQRANMFALEKMKQQYVQQVIKNSRDMYKE